MTTTLRRTLGTRLRPALLALADRLVRAELADRRQSWIIAHAELDSLRDPMRALERRTLASAPRFDRRPLGPGLTVHAAHARDPRVQALFARHGLPDCPGCAVGADETLGEAAFSEGFDVHLLIAEIEALP